MSGREERRLCQGLHTPEQTELAQKIATVVGHDPEGEQEEMKVRDVAVPLLLWPQPFLMAPR